jgi:hypothetical protein
MKRVPAWILILLVLLPGRVLAEYKTVDVTDDNRSKSWIVLPYAFSSETMGFTTGLVGIWNGYGQPQMTTIATAFVGARQTVQKFRPDSGDAKTTEEAQTKGAVLGIFNYRPSFLRRLFVSGFASYAYYPNQQLFIDGSNDSPADSVLKTQGYNNWFYLSLRYVLPWGEGRSDPITLYRLKRGLPVNRDGYGGGKPFVTGRTIAELRPFFNKWTADKLVEEPDWTTMGLKFRLQHDNTDYIDNPSRGYGFRLQYAEDYGWGESAQSWNALEGSYSHFIPILAASWMRQNVIALNLWSAYSPSWDSSRKLNDKNPNALIHAHQPPPWEGARLGGWDRMRGYYSNRFSDKAAIYYGAEYRFIPEFNPLHKERWLPFPIDWFQGVLFAETGRAAPVYNLARLRSHLKFDAGFSIRALAAKVPVRFDMAFGSEGANMWVMVKQTF